MGTWLKDKGSVIGGVAATIAAFVAVLQLFVVTPMNQRFDALERHMDQRFEAQDKYINERFNAVDQRFEAQDKYINERFNAVDQRFDAQDQRTLNLEADMNRQFDRLTDQVAELHTLMVGISERVSRNEGQIEILREQIKTVDTP